MVTCVSPSTPIDDILKIYPQRRKYLLKGTVHSAKRSRNFSLKLNGGFRSTGKVSKKLFHFSRWTMFLGWTSAIKIDHSIWTFMIIQHQEILNLSSEFWFSGLCPKCGCDAPIRKKTMYIMPHFFLGWVGVWNRPLKTSDTFYALWRA